MERSEQLTDAHLAASRLCAGSLTVITDRSQADLGPDSPHHDGDRP